MVRAAGVALALAVTAMAAQAPARAPVWGAPVLVGTLPPEAAGAGELLTVDLNGDGLRDVVVGPWVFEQVKAVAPVFLLNRGHGRFVDATTQLFSGPPPSVEWNREMVSADFNGDGRPDFFIADTGNDNYALNPGWPGQQDRLILSTPGGRFFDATANLPQQWSFTHSACAADVNGDGKVDVFENNLSGVGRDRVQPELLLNDGTGHFGVASGLLHDLPRGDWENTNSLSCAFVDVNSDGAPDLVIGGDNEHARSVVLLNDGKGDFHLFEELPPKLYPPNDGLVMDIRSADVNGDGAPDLLVDETQQSPYYIGTRVQVLINDGHGAFSDETAARLPQQPQGTSWTDRLLIEDLNDDGRPDLALQYACCAMDPTPIWLNRDGVLEAATPPVAGAAPGIRGIVGFVNGDGPHALFSVEHRGLSQGVPSAEYVTPQIVPPPPPRHVRAIPVGRVIRITWRPASGATRYEVSRNGTRISTTVTTRFLDQHPPLGVLRYAVRSANAAGVSDASAAATIRRRG